MKQHKQDKSFSCHSHMYRWQIYDIIMNPPNFLQKKRYFFEFFLFFAIFSLEKLLLQKVVSRNEYISLDDFMFFILLILLSHAFIFYFCRSLN